MQLNLSYTKACLAMALMVGLAQLSSCTEKKKAEGDIIATKPVVVKKKATQSMSAYSQKRSVEWLGKTYVVAMSRAADTSLPLAEDEGGNKYYDNSITVAVERSDGSLFFKRTFHKADFASCISGDYARHGALLGVVFNEVRGDNMFFAASVGSPDNMSDEFVPIVVRLSRTGAVSIYQDSQLDTSASEGDDTSADDDDGV